MLVVQRGRDIFTAIIFIRHEAVKVFTLHVKTQVSGEVSKSADEKFRVDQRRQLEIELLARRTFRRPAERARGRKRMYAEQQSVLAASCAACAPCLLHSLTKVENHKCFKIGKKISFDFKRVFFRLIKSHV